METKWGFGMAPIKPNQIEKYKQAFIDINNFIRDKYNISNLYIPDQISLIKGLFNRILKQDQWDWFTAFVYLDFPPKKDISAIVNHLVLLRNFVIDQDANLDHIIDLLLKDHFEYYMNCFLTYEDNNRKGEYIYILSRRENPNLLYIGSTFGNIIEHVNTINSSIGIDNPYSARMVYKVTKSLDAENILYNELNIYRVEENKNFFQIEYKKACKIIEECLTALIC